MKKNVIIIVLFIIIICLGIKLYEISKNDTTKENSINKNNTTNELIMNNELIINNDEIILNEVNFGNKVDKSKKYVYTTETLGSNELPYININSAKVKTINEKWEKYFNDNKNLMNQFENNAETEIVLSYSYEINCDACFLSLEVKYGEIYNNTDIIPNSEYYNIDISTGKLLSNKELFDKLNISKEEINLSIKNEIKREYNRASKVLPRNYDSFEKYYSKVVFYYDDVYDATIYYKDEKFNILGIITPETLDWPGIEFDCYNY